MNNLEAVHILCEMIPLQKDKKRIIALYKAINSLDAKGIKDKIKIAFNDKCFADYKDKCLCLKEKKCKGCQFYKSIYDVDMKEVIETFNSNYEMKDFNYEELCEYYDIRKE